MMMFSSFSTYNSKKDHMNWFNYCEQFLHRQCSLGGHMFQLLGHFLVGHSALAPVASALATMALCAPTTDIPTLKALLALIHDPLAPGPSILAPDALLVPVLVILALRILLAPTPWVLGLEEYIFGSGDICSGPWGTSCYGTWDTSCTNPQDTSCTDTSDIFSSISDNFYPSP